MTKHQLITAIKDWLTDYEASFPDNVQLDYDNDTFEGSAFQLLGECLYQLEEKK